MAILALVALASTLSYSLGLQHAAPGPGQVWQDAPIDPKTLVLMREAADRARAEGDPAAAEWFDRTAQRQLDEMVNWASRQPRAAAARGD